MKNIYKSLFLLFVSFLAINFQKVMADENLNVNQTKQVKTLCPTEDTDKTNQ